MNNSTEKISIIGGSGFVGSSLSSKFIALDKSFEIIDIKENILFEDKTKIADVTDIDELTSKVSGNILINLAAEHRDDVKPISRYDHVNIEGAKNICKLAELKGIEKIIFTSTVAIYGLSDEQKNEESEINPFNDYGRTKWEAEKVFTSWQQKDPNRRTLVIIRPTVIFGKNNRGNVYNLLKQINSGFFIPIGKCRNIKSMAYVENVASFINHTISDVPGIHIYNYADKPDLELNKIIEIASLSLGKKFNKNIYLPYFLGLVIGYIADFISYLLRVNLPISSIRVKKFAANTSYSSINIKGFEDVIRIEDALKETINYEFNETI
tara:strand:+ start:2811 stop:3782 length:972 start_codon:yes stop_codon:yes gene_type:complete